MWLGVGRLRRKEKKIRTKENVTWVKVELVGGGAEIE